MMIPDRSINIQSKYLPKITLLVLFPFFIFFCKGKEKIPDDFAFRIVWTTSSYDSESGMYRQVYTKGDSAIYAPLNREELESIYLLAKEIDFFYFPPKFECDEKGVIFYMEPSFNTTIEIRANSKYRKSENSSGCKPKVQIQNAANFDKFAQEIKRILMKRERIKKLPISDFIFM